MATGSYSLAEAAPTYHLTATCDPVTHTMHYVSDGPAVARYYDVYQGIVGFGVIKNGSSAGNSDTYDQVNTCTDDVSANPTYLDINSYWFAATFPSANLSGFRDYFSGVSGSPPNNDYALALCNTLGCTSLVGLTIGTSTALGYFDDISASSSFDLIGAQCSGSGNIFSYGICTSFAFLFVPSPDVLDDWSDLASTTLSRFPFSWVVGTKTAITGMSASSTSNMAAYSLNLADLGIGSTSPIGNLMPNIVALSTSTIMTYMPAGVWTAAQTLMAASLWLLVGWDIYATIRRRHAHV